MDQRCQGYGVEGGAQRVCEEWVLDVKDQTEYVEKFGVKRLLTIRADPTLGYVPNLPRRLDQLPPPP